MISRRQYFWRRMSSALLLALAIGAACALAAVYYCHAFPLIGDYK